MNREQENRLLHILLDTIAELNASFDRKNIGDIVVRGLKDVLHLDSSFFYVLDARRENFMLEAQTGDADERREVPVGQGFTGWAGTSGDVFAVSDVAGGRASQFIAMPVRGKKGALGVIGGRSSRASGFDDQEKEAIRIFGSQVGLVVESYIYYHRLQRSKELRDSILFNIPSGVIVVNSEFRVKTYNNSALVVLGEDENMRGKSVYGVFTDELVTGALRSAMASARSVHNVEAVHGGRRLNLAFVPLQEESGGNDVMIVIDDVTELKTAYEERERALRLSYLGQFAAGIAHELRNPLTGINIVLEMVREDPGLSPESGAMIDRVLGENARLAELATSLLEITKPLDLDRRPLPLADVLRRFVDDRRAIAAKRNVSFSFGGTADATVLLDRRRFDQALINLFNNSLESMPAGGTLVFRLSRQGGTATVVVEDTGAGIPAESLGHVFEPFYTTRSTGTGLGLHITRTIIENHGGEIAVESDGKTWTRFTIRLPAMEEQHA